MARGGGARQRHGGTRLCAAARGGGVRAARAGERWHRRAGVELMQSAGAVAGGVKKTEPERRAGGSWGQRPGAGPRGGWIVMCSPVCRERTFRCTNRQVDKPSGTGCFVVLPHALSCSLLRINASRASGSWDRRNTAPTSALAAPVVRGCPRRANAWTKGGAGDHTALR